jgi:hypothetical protein
VYSSAARLWSSLCIIFRPVFNIFSDRASPLQRVLCQPPFRLSCHCDGRASSPASGEHYSCFGQGFRGRFTPTVAKTSTLLSWFLLTMRILYSLFDAPSASASPSRRFLCYSSCASQKPFLCSFAIVFEVPLRLLCEFPECAFSTFVASFISPSTSLG